MHGSRYVTKQRLAMRLPLHSKYFSSNFYDFWLWIFLTPGGVILFTETNSLTKAQRIYHKIYKKLDIAGISIWIPDLVKQITTGCGHSELQVLLQVAVLKSRTLSSIPWSVVIECRLHMTTGPWEGIKYWIGTQLMGLKYWVGTTTIFLLIALNIGWARAPVPPLFLQACI